MTCALAASYFRKKRGNKWGNKCICLPVVSQGFFGYLPLALCFSVCFQGAPPSLVIQSLLQHSTDTESCLAGIGIQDVNRSSARSDPSLSAGPHPYCNPIPVSGTLGTSAKQFSCLIITRLKSNHGERQTCAARGFSIVLISIPHFGVLLRSLPKCELPVPT